MVRTRFAPSPTGYLHIGGVRTALFNWLYARRHGGRFLLRIDDTDRERNVGEALEPILHGLRWLGIDWDEGPGSGGEVGPYFQSQRRDGHRRAAERLVEAGLAYHDYARPEELQAEREAAQAAGRPFVYSRRWMATTGAERREFAGQGRTAAVRLKMPREGVCRFTDLIRGEMQFEWAREQDHVIQRADGSCLYHLASAVDDHEMRISHVIRAEEHLSNTARQIFICQGLGYDSPRYAHLPFVAEPGSKTKLSKRKLERYLQHPDFARLNAQGRAIAEALGLEPQAEAFNPVIVGFYEQIGFLPAALVNYLLLLGWSLDDRTEIFSREEMIEHFSLERVNKAPASFDAARLLDFQARYMLALPAERRVELAAGFLARAGLIADPPGPEQRAVVGQIVEAAGDRIRVAGDVLQYSEFFVEDAELRYDEAAFDKAIRRPPEAAELLRAFAGVLARTEAFEAQALEALTRDFSAEREIRLNRIVHALRVAVSGKAVGFGLFETLAILGRRRCLARIELALGRL